MPDARDERLPWEVLAKRTGYESPWVNVAHWSVRFPDGTVIPDHHVLDYPRASPRRGCGGKAAARRRSWQAGHGGTTVPSVYLDRLG